MTPAALSTPSATTTSAPPVAIWVPCGTCWGQRRIYSNPNGEGLVPHACPACIGTGEQLAVAAGVA